MEPQPQNTPRDGTADPQRQHETTTPAVKAWSGTQAVPDTEEAKYPSGGAVAPIILAFLSSAKGIA